MTAHWGAGEWLTAIGFALGGIWVVSKLLGALWWLVRAPFARLFYHFVDDRVFAGVNPLDDAGDDMSSDEEGEDAAVYVAATMPATQQQSIAIEQNERNALLLQAKAEALAAMVEAGLVTETKGLQVVFNVRPSSTNPRYLAARDALHAELAKRTTPIAGRPTVARFAER